MQVGSWLTMVRVGLVGITGRDMSILDVLDADGCQPCISQHDGVEIADSFRRGTLIWRPSLANHLLYEYSKDN